jgi:hypothetical protein
MGIVAGHATERPCTVPVALGLHQADWLEPHKVRVIVPDLLRAWSRRVPVAAPAQAQELRGSPPVRTERQRQLGLRCTTARRRDVSTPRAVTALARNVGNHPRFVDPLAAAGRDLGRMAAETVARIVGWGHAAEGRQSRQRRLHLVTGSQAQRTAACIVGKPMLEDGRDAGIDHADEGRGVVARAEGILGGAFLELPRAVRAMKNWPSRYRYLQMTSGSSGSATVVLSNRSARARRAAGRKVSACPERAWSAASPGWHSAQSWGPI